MTGEILGDFIQRVMDEGALDIYYTPVIMKKNRPAIQITLLCKLEDQDKFKKILLTETSTFGVRHIEVTRTILERKFQTLKTKYGNLKVKCGYFDNKLVKVTPEYESVKLLARNSKYSFLTIYNMSISVIQSHYFGKNEGND